MNIDKLLEERIQSAEAGRIFWKELQQKHQFSGKDYIVIFPDENTKCNYYVLKHLDKFAEKNKCKRFFFLTVSSDIKQQAEQFVNTEYCIVDCEKKAVNDLITYYMLQMFTENLLIASLDKPEGRNGKNIIGVNGITEEEVAAIGILGLREI